MRKTAQSGERDAALRKSGDAVAHSVPVLKGPTLSATADRTSAARMGAMQGAILRPAFQPKSGQGAGQSPAISSQREALHPENENPNAHLAGMLDEHHIQVLVEFFTILDGWDREAHEFQSL
jgi:hypothetical protein